MNPRSPLQFSHSKPPNPLAELRDRGWVSLRDFAKIADVTYQTALRWSKLEMIRITQVGGKKRVYEDEIIRFLQYGTLPKNTEKWEAERTRKMFIPSKQDV